MKMFILTYKVKTHILKAGICSKPTQKIRIVNSSDSEGAIEKLKKHYKKLSNNEDFNFEISEIQYTESL